MMAHDGTTKTKKQSWTYGKSSKKILRDVAKAMATSIPEEETDTHLYRSPSDLTSRSYPTKSQIAEPQLDSGLRRNASSRERVVAKRSEELNDVLAVLKPVPSTHKTNAKQEITSRHRPLIKRQSPFNVPESKGKRRKLVQQRDSCHDASPTCHDSSNESLSSSSITSQWEQVRSRRSSSIQGNTKARPRAALTQASNGSPNNKNEISSSRSKMERSVAANCQRVGSSVTQFVSSYDVEEASQKMLDTTASGDEDATPQPNVKRKALTSKRKLKNVKETDVPSPGSLPIPQLCISTKLSRRYSEGPILQSQIPEKHVSLSQRDEPACTKLREKLRSLQDHDSGSRDTAVTGEEEASQTALSVKQMNQGKSHTSSIEELDGNVGMQHRGLRLTYAAGNRTLLQETDDVILQHPINAQQSSQSSRRMRELPSPSQRKTVRHVDEEDESPGQSAISSIYELRQAGYRQRLNRRADALVDDMENNSSITGRRSALVSIVKELQSPVFMHLWLDSARNNQLLMFIESGSDPILDVLMILIIYRVIRHSTYSSIFQPQSLDDISALLKRCLRYDEDMTTLLKHPKYQVPEDLQKDILTICNAINASPLGHSSTASETSCRLLSLHLLEKRVRQSREAGSTDNLLSREVLGSLIDILADFDYSLSKTKLQSSKDCFMLALSILESSAVVYNSSDQDCERFWAKRNVEDVGKLVPKILTYLERDEQLVSLAFRLCLNLSNRNLWVCTLLSKPDVIHTTLNAVADYFSILSERNANSEPSLILDNLVLGLGFLINLCEKLQSTRELFLKPHGNATPPIEVILSLFLDRLPDAFEVTSEAETRSNVPFGWLAVLLAYLSKNQSVCWRLKGRLKDGSLRQLVDAVGEFVTYHRRVAADVQHANAGEEVQFNFTERLQSLLDGLKQEEGLL